MMSRMIVLDTNVIAETMRPTPSSKVLAWLDAQEPNLLYTTAVTEAELRFGIAKLAEGKRRDALAQALDGAFATLFYSRSLAFDSQAARAYAEIVTHRAQIGRPISQFDAQIAAIARTHGAHLATRNIRDFTACGVDLIDPWQWHT